jgi:hypothetical protein
MTRNERPMTFIEPEHLPLRVLAPCPRVPASFGRNLRISSPNIHLTACLHSTCRMGVPRSRTCAPATYPQSLSPSRPPQSPVLPRFHFRFPLFDIRSSPGTSPGSALQTPVRRGILLTRSLDRGLVLETPRLNRVSRPSLRAPILEYP